MRFPLLRQFATTFLVHHDQLYGEKLCQPIEPEAQGQPAKYANVQVTIVLSVIGTKMKSR